MKLSFRITRHGYSCNNINVSILEKGIFSDSDPSLSIWGIIETFNHGKKNIEYFNSNNIYVSCLVRTWITAILLYIHHINKINSNNKIIILNIVPFLKEKHNNLIVLKDRGNLPEVFNKQINKVILLLKYCFSILNEEEIKLFKDLTIIIKSFDLYNISIYINNKLNIKTEINYIKRKKLNTVPGLIKLTDIKLKTYNTYTFNDNNEYINYLNKIKLQTIKSNINYNKLTINNILNTSLYNKYKITTPNYEYKGITFYEKYKNINYFINWYIDNKFKSKYFDNNSIDNLSEIINKDKLLRTSKKNKRHNIIKTTRKTILNNTFEKCIHCVSHSNVMQQFIFSLVNNKEALEHNKILNKIFKTNCWSMQININNNIIKELYLTNGVYAPIIYINNKKTPLFINNKLAMSIKQCELLCYRDHVKRNIITKKKCNKQIKKYEKKYIVNSKKTNKYRSQKKTLKKT
jgi:hypothetical protein